MRPYVIIIRIAPITRSGGIDNGRNDESIIAYTVLGRINVLPYACVESIEDDLFPKRSEIKEIFSTLSRRNQSPIKNTYFPHVLGLG